MKGGKSVNLLLQTDGRDFLPSGKVSNCVEALPRRVLSQSVRRIPIIFLTLFFLTLPVEAYVEVENTISTTADTGGNTANGGQIVESSAKATVDVKTTVNGATVQEVSKTVEGTGPTEINDSRAYEDGNTSVKTNVSVKINATTSTSSLSGVKSITERKVELKAGILATTTADGQSTSTLRQENRRFAHFSRLKQFFLYVFARFTFK